MGFTFPTHILPALGWGTTASACVSVKETVSGGGSDRPEPSSAGEARLGAGGGGGPSSWLQSPQLIPGLRTCSLSPFQLRPCNNLSQVPPGFSNPFTATICLLLNLAADLFPQLIGCNCFVLVCKKAVALPSILSSRGASTPVPTSSGRSRQEAGSPPHFTGEA